MTKQMLMIIGGPYENGTTDKMAFQLTESFKKQGWNNKTIKVYKKDLKPCRGCQICRRTGDCPIHDDIDELKGLFLSSALIAVSAPTYFANIPGPLKNLFDRLSGVILDERSKPKLEREKRYILMTSCTTPAPFNWIAGQSSGAIRAMNEFFKMAGMSCRGKIVYPAAAHNSPLPTRIIKKIERVAK